MLLGAFAEDGSSFGGHEPVMKAINARVDRRANLNAQGRPIRR